jgi:hypothetical protein
MSRLLLFLLIGFTISVNAQPLMPGWSEMLLGKWRVEKMNNQTIDNGVNMFLEFKPDKLLMINPQSTREADWRVNEAEREILIKSEDAPLEAWQLRYIDSSNLALFDTLGFTTLFLRRYNIPSDLFPVQVSKSQICGTWLLVNIDGQPIPNNINLELQISSLDKFKLKVGAETKNYDWTFNKATNGIKFQQDSTISKVWVFISLENDRMSFLDNGRRMNFTRYNAPLTQSQEKLISAKWKIAEVEGVSMPNSQTVSRYMEMKSDGKMYFYSNDKKEGEGNWGMNSSKTGFFVISGDGTEQWLVYHLNEKEMLLEMEGLKMLLVR